MEWAVLKLQKFWSKIICEIYNTKSTKALKLNSILYVLNSIKITSVLTWNVTWSIKALNLQVY